MRAIPLFLLLAACVCTPAAALHSPRDLLSAFFRFLDVDGDNAVTHDEVHQRVLSTGSAHHPPAAPGEHLAHNVSRTFTEHLSRWDRDGDGSVSLPELFDRAALGSAAKTMRASGFGSWLGLSNMFDPHYPAQVHLALAGASTNMTVMWLTRSPYAEAPLVEYWQLSGGPVLRAVGSSATYGVPKRWWGGFHGWVHTAVMEGLAPGREHGYRVGGVPADGGELVWGAVHPFRAPRPPASDALTRLVTFGDMGTVMPLGLAVCEQIILDYARAGANWDGVMHVGDLAYAGIATNIPLLNITSGDEWEPIWDLWGAQIEPLASRMPYMTGVGNHESFYNYVAFRHRFRMPGPESGGEGNFWFSFDMGNVHVTSLSTEHDYSPGSAQLRWLEQDLARAVANRARVPWLVVTGHRPMYCSDQDEANQHMPGAPFQRHVEPVLLRHGVDLVITGHMHAYERTHPVANGSRVALPLRKHLGADVYVSPPAPVHLVVGTAGALQRESWLQPTPQWSAVRKADTLDSYGYGLLTAHNATHLEFEFKGLGGGAGDRMWIEKVAQ